MIEGVSLRNPLFINTLGHACGVLLFGLLIVLLLRGWSRSKDRQRSLSLAAACLAFTWNLGSLIGLASTHRDGEIAGWVVAVNFSALSVLPAILLKIVLRQRYPLLVNIGFALALSSVGLHFAELYTPSAGLHDAALLLITAGFTALIGCVYAFSFRNREQISLTDVICLLLFTLSFLHFGYGHSKAAWTNEVAWHHAGIPLALIVLLRDYRLLFLETFIRFAANFGLGAVCAFALYWANKSGHLVEHARGNGFVCGMLLIGFCFSLVLFAYIRTLLQKQLTRRMFRRADLNACSKRILQISSESESEKELLHRAAAELCSFVEANGFQISNAPSGHAARYDFSPELELPLRFSRGDALTLQLAVRRGGARYLPEDTESLTQLCGLLIEQVERFRTNELQRLAHEAELRALQAQINPHFLFNALNTIYGTIGRESYQARRLVLNLADLFRYCLQRDKPFISLGEELSIVQAYLEIESLRLGDRLSTEVSISETARRVMIPSLMVQPLVENAIKHGAERRGSKAEVRVVATESDGFLKISVYDNGPGLAAEPLSSGLGMALKNVRQRLHLCYGDSASLNVEFTPEGTCATLVIPRQASHQVHSNAEADRMSRDSRDTATAEPAEQTACK